jgi:hypothetical protein
MNKHFDKMLLQVVKVGNYDHRTESTQPVYMVVIWEPDDIDPNLFAPNERDINTLWGLSFLRKFLIQPTHSNW